MGWYQDKFPGSAAARQRILISRAVVLYSFTAGTIIYLFSPFCRRIRKEFEDGNVLSEWRWFTEKREIKKIGNPIYSKRQDFIDYKQFIEKESRGDTSGPDLSEESLRKSIL